MANGQWYPAEWPERIRALAEGRLTPVEPRRAATVMLLRDTGPDTGPHPVSRELLTEAFNPGTGWNVVAIEPDRVLTRFHDDNGAPAWLATLNRT